MAEVATAWRLREKSICTCGVNNGGGGVTVEGEGLRTPSTYDKLSTLDIKE